MKTEEELDNLFKNAASNIKVPIYQETFFDDIEHLLPKKKKYKNWFLLLPFLIVTPFFVDFGNNVDFVANNYFSSNIEKLNTNKVNLDKRQKTNAIQENQKNNYKSEQRTYTQKTASFSSDFKDDPTIYSFYAITKENLIFDSENKGNINILETKKGQQIDLSLGENGIKELPFFKPTKNANYLLNLQAGIGQALTNNINANPIYQIKFGFSRNQKLNSFRLEYGFEVNAILPNDLTLTKKSIVYSIRVAHYTQNVTYNAVVGIGLPLNITKSIKNHDFSLGIKPQYNFGSFIHLKQYRNSEEITNEKMFNSNYGINKWNLEPSLAYHFNYKNNFKIGVNISTYLFKTVDFSQYQVTSSRLPISGQISIKKYLGTK